MERELLDRKKINDILDEGGPGFLESIVISPMLKAHLVREKVISHQLSQDMRSQSDSDQKATLLDVLYRASVLHFLCFCLVLHNFCNQGHIVSDVFNLDIHHLLVQKGQIEKRRGRAQNQPASTAGQPQHGGVSTDYSHPPQSDYPPPQYPYTGHPTACPTSSTSEANTAHPSMHPPQPQQQQPVYNTWGNATMGSHWGDGTPQSSIHSVPPYTQPQGLQPVFNIPRTYMGEGASYPQSTEYHNTEHPHLHHSATGNMTSPWAGGASLSIPYSGHNYRHPQPQPTETQDVNIGSVPNYSQMAGNQDLDQHPPKRRKADMKTLDKKVHHCSFILENDFKAGDSNLQSLEYTAFVSKMERGLRVTLQEYTGALLKVLVMCISQLKRMVFIRIECHEGLTEGDIQQALWSPNNELTKSSLHICPSTLLFRGEIPAMLASDIILKRHMEDSLGRKIDFNTQYVRLKIISPDSLAALRRDELERPDRYQQALQQSRGMDITDEDVIKAGEVVKYVLVRGRAGIGKSTLVQCLMWRWAHGEWGTQFKAIFLLSLRHLMAMTSMDFPNLLTRFAVHRVGQRDITLHAGWLQENQRQVAFILDGIDEVQKFREEWEKAHTKMSLGKDAPALAWGFALMTRKCLPESTLIVTSRPFSDLCYFKPTMMVEVMGLTKERVMEFVEKNVEPQRVKMVQETLKNRPILLSVSSITFYCAALCKVLQDDIGVTEKLTTYTQITAYIMERFISHSAKMLDSNDTMSDLSSGLQAMTRLAYNGILKCRDGGLAQLVFDEEDFHRQNIKQEDVDNARRSGMFMQTEVQGIKKKVLGEFVHLSIQEFMAMIGLLMQSPTEVKGALKMMSSSGQFNMALLFLYGFAFNRNGEGIKRLCAALGLRPDVGDEIHTILRENIRTVVEQLQVLQMVHESQSAEVARLVGQCRFPHEVRIKGAKMTVVDILALIFLLKNHHSATSIKLNEVGLDVISMRELSDFLKYNKTVTILQLSDDELDDEYLQSLKEVLQVNKTITQLEISSIKVSDEGVKCLADAMTRNNTLTTLVIQSDKVSDEGVKCLADALTRNNTLTTLILTSLEDEGAAALLQALAVNERVTVWIERAFCGLSLKQQLEAHSRIDVGH